jgi:hypothetical protein
VDGLIVLDDVLRGKLVDNTFGLFVYVNDDKHLMLSKLWLEILDKAEWSVIFYIMTCCDIDDKNMTEVGV